MERDSLIFYRSFFEAIKNLPDNDRLECYDAICLYGIEGEEKKSLSPIANMAFMLTKPQIDANNKRFSDGNKGGRPKKETSGYGNEKPVVIEKQENKKPKEKEKEKENVKEKDNVNNKENNNSEGLGMLRPSDSDTSIEVLEKEKTPLDKKIQEFLIFRKQMKKPILEASKKDFIKKLEKLSEGSEENAIEILSQSIANGWQGIFQVQEQNKVRQAISNYNFQ